MARTKFYLDTRGSRSDGRFPLKLQVSHRGRNTLLSVEVFVRRDQWSRETERVVKHPLQTALNNRIAHFRIEVEERLVALQQSGELDEMAMPVLRRRLLGIVEQEPEEVGEFVRAFEAFASTRPKESTRGVYRHTLSRIRAFAPDCERLRFEDITRGWLGEFEAFLALTSPSANARSVHLRNIRAVFNHAIDEELTTLYPFRRFKIKSEPTAKRSLPVEQLRELFSLEVEDWERKYLDMFKLIFFLCGINIVDLCHLREMRYGRVVYRRAKTGRVYDLKVEPEALAIIERYRGEGWLLDIMDTYKSHKDFAHRMNDSLKFMGGTRYETQVAADGKLRRMRRREMRWPGLSTYWARHTWATIAASLDIPKETIAAALGHSQNSVTDIYIAFDQSKVDRANRAVMDWVLYGKK